MRNRRIDISIFISACEYVQATSKPTFYSLYCPCPIGCKAAQTNIVTATSIMK